METASKYKDLNTYFNFSITDNSKWFCDTI